MLPLKLNRPMVRKSFLMSFVERRISPPNLISWLPVSRVAVLAMWMS